MIRNIKLELFIILFLGLPTLTYSDTSECSPSIGIFNTILDSLGVLLLMIFISVPVLVKIIEWNEKKKEKRLGYRIEYHSPNSLRDGPDDFAIVYHQDGKDIWYYGKIINNEYILNLDIPEGAGYNEVGPKGINRKLMKSRILDEIRKFKHMKLKE